MGDRIKIKKMLQIAALSMVALGAPPQTNGAPRVPANSLRGLACSSYLKDECLKDHADECAVDKDGKCVLKKEEEDDDDEEDKEEDEEEAPPNLNLKSCPGKDDRGHYICPYPYNCITYTKGYLQKNNGDDAFPLLVGKKVCELEWYASQFHFEQCLSELPKDKKIQCEGRFTKCLNRTSRKVSGEEVKILQPGLTKKF